MSIKSFFQAIVGFFKMAGRSLVQLEGIMPEALFVVKLIAEATPTRSDDELLKLATSYGFGPVQVREFGRKEDLLRAIARVALQRKLRLSLKDSMLNAAIELAVLEHKGR